MAVECGYGPVYFGLLWEVDCFHSLSGPMLNHWLSWELQKVVEYKTFWYPNQLVF